MESSWYASVTLSDADREFVEATSQKWGMTGYLPSGHAGLDTSGWALQRIKFNGVSAILVVEELTVKFVPFPSSDMLAQCSFNLWRGTRKLYIDGEEVSSVSSSGSITANANALIFGGTDMNSSAAAADEIKIPAVTNHSGIKLDEVRFYNSGLSAAEVTALYNYGKGDLARIGGFSSIPSVISATAGTHVHHRHRRFWSTNLFAYNLQMDYQSIHPPGNFRHSTVGGHEISVRYRVVVMRHQKSIFHYHLFCSFHRSKVWRPGAQNVVGDSVTSCRNWTERCVLQRGGPSLGYLRSGTSIYPTGMIRIVRG